jgi:hypothetical protein
MAIPESIAGSEKPQRAMSSRSKSLSLENLKRAAPS